MFVWLRKLFRPQIVERNGRSEGRVTESSASGIWVGEDYPFAGSPAFPPDVTSYVERLAKALASRSLPLGVLPQNSSPATSPLIEDEQLAELLWKDIFSAVSFTELILAKDED